MRAMGKCKCWAVAATMLLPGGGAALAGNAYVVIATDPAIDALPLGKVLEVSQQLEVPAGAVLTLLGDDGTVTTVQGPQKLVVTEEPVSDSPEAIETRTTFKRISDLLLGSSADADILGASRSVGGSADSGNGIDPWAIPIDRPGAACIKGTSLVLQRSGQMDDVALTVTVNGKPEVYNATWPRNRASLTLPDIGEDEVKTLTVDIGGSIRDFVVHRLPDSIDAKRGMDVLAWALESKCTVQALRLARTLSE